MPATGLGGFEGLKSSTWMLKARIVRRKTGLFVYSSTAGSTTAKTVYVDFLIGNRYTTGAKFYTEGDYYVLPTTSAPLRYPLSDSEVNTLSGDDTTYVTTNGPLPYRVVQFKYVHSNNTDQITVTWNGKSDIAPTARSVTLQIFNVNSGSWETLQTNSAASADTDFTLTGSKTTSVADYYDSNNVVTARVYQ